MSDSDSDSEKPSISALTLAAQVAFNVTVGLSAPHTVRLKPEVLAVLLEIAATGIEWSEAEDALATASGLSRVRAAVRATRAFDMHRAALAKVRP